MQLKLLKKLFFMVTFCFFVLLPFQVLAIPTVTCNSPMSVTQGVGGSHPVAAVASVDTDNIVAFGIIVSPAEPGITLENITPPLPALASVTGDITVDNSVLAGTYTVTVTAEEDG